MKGLLIKTVTAAVCLVCAWGTADGQRRVTDGGLGRWAAEYMDDAVRFDHFGGVVLVGRGAKVLWARAYGPSDADGKTLNRLGTRFRIGSVSKQFTAAAILLLRDDGRLGLDAPACGYLETCPDAWRAVTVRQLLGHTSGIPNFTALDAAQGAFLERAHTPRELVGLFDRLPLESAPGADFSYNNSGYLLAAMIVERLSGEKFERFVRRRIFAPLGMRDTGFETDADARRPGVATTFLLGDDAVLRPSPPVAMENLFGIGGAYSTAADLLRWTSALSEGRILSESSRREMFTPGAGEYGLGWYVGRIGDCRRRYHDGGLMGASASVQALDGGPTIIAISNRGDDGGIRAAYDIVGKACRAPATIRALQKEMMTLPSESLLTLIEDARKTFPRFDASEPKIEEIGNYLLLTNRRRQALEVFRLNTLLHPESTRAKEKLAALR